MILEDKNVVCVIMKNIGDAGHHGWTDKNSVKGMVSIWMIPKGQSEPIEIVTAQDGQPLWEAFVDWCNTADETYGVYSVPSFTKRELESVE
jgi:hypothetical protein